MLEVKIKTDPSEVLVKAAAHLRAVGYEAEVEGNSIRAVNGRDYTGGWCVLFFLLGILPFLVYWFTRKENRVIITAVRGKLSITYDGRRGASDARMLMDVIERS